MKETILQIIDDTKTNKINKWSRGEVFTPNQIITDMLDTLPSHVWKDPTLKWLDPTSGIGNFPVFIYWRLMHGLSTVIVEEQKRSKHIIETMITMIEIDSDNIDKTKHIFKLLDPHSKLQIIHTDFLTYTTEAQYDIIVNNPPYNIGGIGRTGKKHVYVYFINKMFELLKQKGLLLIIHPSTYRLGNYKIRGTKINLNEIYTSYQIHTICMYSITQIFELMEVQINVDYLLVENTPQYKKTSVTDLFGKEAIITIRQNDTIVNYGFNSFKTV